MTAEITLDQLTEIIPDEKRAWLDKSTADFDQFPFGSMQHFWQQNGFFLLNNFISHQLLDAYAARYEADNGAGNLYGYLSGTQYMAIPEIKHICLYAPLTEILDGLIGEPMGLSLNLCAWVSSERNWHQDDYLNPPDVNGHYLACWIALDDIHPDSGVFQFVPGSHKWPVMRGEKVRAMLTHEEQAHDRWPKKAERFVNKLYDEEIERRGAEIMSVDLKKGDVLIWHSWLVHRGSAPKTPGMERRALIAHYSGIHHRPDMAKPQLYENTETNSKGYFFPF